MDNDSSSVSMTELQVPTAMFDSGDDMVREVAKGAVNNMIATAGTLVIFNKRVLGAMFQSVRRRSLVLIEQGKEPLKLWSHRTHGPSAEYREGRWLVKIRQPGEAINPFYGGERQHRHYGFWLAQADQLINGKEIDVASAYEFQRLGQSFRFACDRRGYYRQGRMMRKRPNDKGGFTVYLAKPLRTLAEVEGQARPAKDPKAKTPKPARVGKKPAKAKTTAKPKKKTK
jgi:hypothetical protein